MSQRKTTRRFVQDRAEFRASCAARREPCWICRQDHIDYDAAHDDYTNGDRFELDHYFPVSTHPDLQHDPSNFRASAHDCNNDRGNGPPRPGLGMLSQEWT